MRGAYRPDLGELPDRDDPVPCWSEIVPTLDLLPVSDADLLGVPLLWQLIDQPVICLGDTDAEPGKIRIAELEERADRQVWDQHRSVLRPHLDEPAAFRWGCAFVAQANGGLYELGGLIGSAYTDGTTATLQRARTWLGRRALLASHSKPDKTTLARAIRAVASRRHP